MTELQFRPLETFPYSDGSAYSFSYGGRFYVLHEGRGPGNKWHTVIFEADESGRVQNWTHCAGGAGTRETALEELKRKRGPLS